MACELITRGFTGKDGDSIVVAVRQLPATRALDLQSEVLNVCGTVIFDLIEGDYDFPALISIIGKTPHDLLTPLVRKTIVGCAIDGVEVEERKLDRNFDGDILLMMQVFAFVLEVNFKDFLLGGKALQEKRKLAAAAALKRAEQSQES